MAIDKVTLQVLANHTRAAAENMAYTLYRTAHSTFVKETQDFTVMLTDTAGLGTGSRRSPNAPQLMTTDRRSRMPFGMTVVLSSLPS